MADATLWGNIIQGASQIGGGVLSMIGQKNREIRAMRNTKELMDIQNIHQAELDRLGQQLQLDTWEKTNYPAQVEMLKKAGLNPALLYGHGGGGGATTGSQGGGSAASGSAPAPQQMPYMDLGSSLARAAEIALINAQTKKTEAETEVISETGKPKAESETALNKANAAYTEVKTEIEQINKASRQYQIDAELQNIAELTNKYHAEGTLTTENMQNIINETKAKAIGQTIENELSTAKINLTNTEKQAIITGIQQKWAELNIQTSKLSLEQSQQKINKFEAEIKAEYPSISDVIGGIAKKAYKSIKNFENFLTGNTEPIKDTVK